MRYELPSGIPEEDERAVVAALDEYFGTGMVRLSPWALAGRAEALGVGALQIRHQSDRPWNETRLNPYTRRGTESRAGRGDRK